MSVPITQFASNLFCCLLMLLKCYNIYKDGDACCCQVMCEDLILKTVFIIRPFFLLSFRVWFQ